MKRPTKLAMGAGLLGALLLSPIPAADDNPDAFKLPDRAQAYATDDAAMRQAQRQQADAKADVVRARQQVVTQSLLSPKYRQAVSLVDSTNEKYQTLKRQVQAELTKGDARYQALLKERAAADQELAAARGSNAAYQTFQDLYARKEKTTNAIREAEEAALDKAGGGTARAEWTAACAALDDMRKGQRTQVESTPEVVAAKQKLAQSQQALDQTATKLAGSQAAYEEASYQQGKEDDYNYHHRGDSLDYWDNTGWYGRNITVYRGPRVAPRR